MTNADRIAKVIRRLTAKNPIACIWKRDENDETTWKAFTALKGFSTELRLQMMDAGYEAQRPEELHVMRTEFEAEVPEHEAEIVVDEDTFKLMEISAYPTKQNPLFFKYKLVKQN